MLLVPTVAAIVIGFLAGLLSFKIKRRWCPTCGATLTCPDAASHVPSETPIRTEVQR